MTQDEKRQLKGETLLQFHETQVESALLADKARSFAQRLRDMAASLEAATNESATTKLNAIDKEVANHENLTQLLSELDDIHQKLHELAAKKAKLGLG